MADSPQDDVLPLPKLKQVLGLAEKKRLGCAFALTKDKKDVALLIDKMAKPKKVRDLLKTGHKALIDEGSLRFGEVYLNEDDLSTVRFDINRAEAGGTITHMNKLIKKAGYQGLVINPVEALESAPENDAEGVPAAPPPPPQAPVIDAAALKARLTALVQQMAKAIGADPSRKDALMALAKQAQVLLATNNLKGATEQTDALEAALGVPGAAPKPGPSGAAPNGAVAYAKSRLAWIATRQRLEGELGKLRSSLESEYKDEPDGMQVVQAFDVRVEPVLAAFDMELADRLDEATNATDDAVRAKLVADAKALVGKYKAYLDGEKLIADLDDNPFVPLAIRATLGATLTALGAAVH